MKIFEEEKEKMDDLNQTSCVTRGGEPVRNMNMEQAHWSTDVMNCRLTGWCPPVQMQDFENKDINDSSPNPHPGDPMLQRRSEKSSPERIMADVLGRL